MRPFSVPALSSFPAVALPLVALFAALLTSCDNWSASSSDTNADGATLQVVASTDVWGSIATVVGGDSVAVTSLISAPDQDPHSYQSSVRDVLAVKEADVLIENGGGYDDFFDTLIKSSETNATVLNAVDISGHSATAGDELNEHVWYDLRSAQAVALQIARALGQADPARADDFTANAKAFNAQVGKLVEREATLRVRFSGVGVGITEPVPLYLLQAVGAVNRTPPDFSEAVEEGEDVSVAVLDQTLNLYRDHEVAALVYNEQTDSAVTEVVKQAGEDAGVPVVGFTETLPAGTTYVSWMTSNLSRVAGALSRG